MAYFIPVSFQKRLLRYALSRLELLDTDALDLERLEIEWGRRSTVELRDIALRKDRLAQLLHLPDRLAVQAATVGVLRVTVPADIHTSSIAIEITKVHARASLQDEDESKSGDAGKHTATKKPPSSHTFSGGLDELEEEQEAILPTPHDLAQSFLAQEPAAQRAQLEAELESRSVDLRRSTTSSSDNTDDDSVQGLGIGLTLPTFLADFLKGISNRLTVVIRDVSLQLELQLDMPTEENLDGTKKLQPTPTAIKVVAKDVQIDGVTTSLPRPTTATPANTTYTRVGKRRIALSDVQCLLLTESGAFEQLSEILQHGEMPTSPRESEVSPVAESPVASMQDPVSPERSASRSDDGFFNQESPQQSSHSLGNLKASVFSSTSSRFADADEEAIANQNIYGQDSGPLDDYLFQDTLDESTPNVGGFGDSQQYPNWASANLAAGYSSRISDDGTTEDMLRTFRSERQESFSSRTSAPHRMRLLSGRFPREEGEISLPTDHYPGLVESQVIDSDNGDSVTAFNSGIMQSSSAEQPYEASDSQQATNSDDYLSNSLTESKFFSPETAKSIYMSVTNDESSQEDSRVYNVPGAWNESQQLSSMESHFQHQEPSTTTSATTKQQSDDENLKDHNAITASKSGSTHGIEGGTNHSPDPFAKPSIISKSIVSLDLFQLWIPESSESDASMMDSMAASQAVSRSFDSPSQFLESRSPTTETRSNKNTDIDIELGFLKISVDLGIIRVALLLYRQLACLFVVEGSTTNKNTKQNTAAQNEVTTSLIVSHLILAMHEKLDGDAPLSGGESTRLPEESPTSPLILFESRMIRLRHDSRKTELGLRKCGIKFQHNWLLCFDRSASMRASIRDTRDPHADDVSIILQHSQSSTDATITTLPVQINLDPPRLDEALASFGGFSGLMELGSSVFSDPGKAMGGERTRTVRFDTGPTEAVPAAHKFKMNVRLAGSSIVFESKTCSMSFNSSAIKLVARDSLFGLQIDEMLLRGPHNGDPQTSDMDVRLHNTSVKYLVHPQEKDLDRMIDLLTPSRDKFGDDDDFLSDTLIRQRKRGACMRLNIGKTDINVYDIKSFKILEQLAAEMSRLSVTKYLPQDARPGLLTLGLLEKISVNADDVPRLGSVQADLLMVDFAHVGAPSLLATRVDSLSCFRNADEALIIPVSAQFPIQQSPMLRARFIGDELEPTLKLKLWNVCLEYNVTLAIDLSQPDSSDTLGSGLASSIATLTGRVASQDLNAPTSPTNPAARSDSARNALSFELLLTDCAIGLKPLGKPSKGVFALTQAQLNVKPSPSELEVHLDLRKASLHLIDETQKIQPSGLDEGGVSLHQIDQLDVLRTQGFVPMAWISVASATVTLIKGETDSHDKYNIEIQDELFVLESCADSTQTLIELLTCLQPPRPPSTGQKYRTEASDLQDMVASFTEDAYARQVRNPAAEDNPEVVFEQGDPAMLEGLDEFAEFGGLELDLDSEAAEDSVLINTTASKLELSNTSMPQQSLEQSEIVGSMNTGPEMLPAPISGTGAKWDSVNNRYVQVSKTDLAACPLNVKVKDVHFIWNLFDGYDWEHTRETISNAVADVEKKAEERRAARTITREDSNDEESVIGDFLFNSIYIGVPVTQDPRELRQQINRNMDDLVSETGSQATTTTSRTTSVQGQARPRQRRLKLERSKRHKIAFEVRGLSVDMFAFPPGSGETQSSIDVRIKDFEIFDHVPTSTWKKFVTYMQDAGPREDRKPMIHLEICDVRPVPELTASELVIRVTVLPMRLHVDQDALDFLTRFFEFKTDAAKAAAEKDTGSSKDQIYLQRVEVLPVPVTLDYKPKKIDFAGIRSGRTTEFMNFFILDAARFTLRHAIIYGCSSPDKLQKALEDVWMPDIRRNQLPSVLSGLNGVRTLVNVGAGVRDLVVVPVREYRKDGRIVRSVGKGALAFARGAGGELTRFGAKLAVGAQGMLQNAEDFLSQRPTSPSTPLEGASGAGGPSDWEDAELSGAERRRAISAYASQPTNILQGLKGAARSLERDLLVARDVVIAVSGEVREGGGIGAIARGAPTVVLRPMIGVSKALGQTLMGATNSVDPEGVRRLEDKYKRY